MSMEVLFTLIPFLTIPIVIGGFAYYYYGGKRRLDIETGKTPLLEEQCGGRFNGFNLTIPFVRHAIYPEFAVIAYGRKNLVVKFEELMNATASKHMFSTGIHYNHNSSSLPKECIVWSLNTTKVLSLLQNAGVKTNA